MEIVLDSSMFGEEAEVELVAWTVNDGDLVTTGQIIAEFETGKAAFELPAPGDGRIAIFIPAGTIVEVGTKIGAIK